MDKKKKKDYLALAALITTIVKNLVQILIDLLQASSR